MRIIAGRLGGRNFDAPRGHRTHPMSDKARGGIFNALGDIEGLTVLDAFAGSGALGFEALSRGAASALLLDLDKSAQQIIVKNIQSLGLNGRAKLIKAGAGAWSDNNPDARFNLVLCDPPYDNFKPNLLVKLSRHVKPGGILAVSHPPDITPPTPSGMEFVRQKSYGDAQVMFLRTT